MPCTSVILYGKWLRLGIIGMCNDNFFFFTFEYFYFLLRTAENGIKIKTACCLVIILCRRHENNSGLYITFYSFRFAE